MQQEMRLVPAVTSLNMDEFDVLVKLQLHYVPFVNRWTLYLIGTFTRSCLIYLPIKQHFDDKEINGDNTTLKCGVLCDFVAFSGSIAAVFISRHGV